MSINFTPQSKFDGLHVAVIMDGNGRWAERRGLPRSAGHVAGARAVESIVRAAPALGIGTLTVFALSSDNWSRPTAEVDAILELARTWLAARADECAHEGIRLSQIGRRDRLPTPLLQAIECAEERTRTSTRLHVRIAIDYSSRDAIMDAARRFHVACALDGDRRDFGRVLSIESRTGSHAGDVDLLLRSGGEQRLSDFLLWECAYAELVFSDVLWPDVGAIELARAVEEFRSRKRRFGGLPASDVG